MDFEPNVEVTLDVITRRRIPDRIPSFEPYFDPKTVALVLGKPFPAGPYRTKEAWREVIELLIEWSFFTHSDVLQLVLEGPALPMRRDMERSATEEREYLTHRDLPTIRHREDYVRYPWPTEEQMGLCDSDKLMLETAAEMLPEGMGIVASKGGIFEIINYLAGYEDYVYLLKDDPALIDEMADRLGEINLRVFSEAAEYDCIDILHMGDDIAFRSGLIVAPELLRKWLFPWMKQYTDVCHKHGKPFTYHSDGDFRAVMEDIIAAGVDGKQAFEELSYKVTDCKRDYGDRISLLGGIDVGRMTQLPEDELRKYVREVLEVCAPGGGYTVGSGNCFACYIPVANYMAMLEEAEAYSYG